MLWQIPLRLVLVSLALCSLTIVAITNFQAAIVIEPDWTITTRPLLACRVAQWSEYRYPDQPNYSGPATRKVIFVKVELVSSPGQPNETVIGSSTDFVEFNWSAYQGDVKADQLELSGLNLLNQHFTIRYCLSLGYTVYFLYHFGNWYLHLLASYFVIAGSLEIAYLASLLVVKLATAGALKYQAWRNGRLKTQ